MLQQKGKQIRKKEEKTGTNKIKQRTKSEEKSKIRREKSENCRQEINQQHLTMLLTKRRRKTRKNEKGGGKI